MRRDRVVKASKGGELGGGRPYPLSPPQPEHRKLSQWGPGRSNVVNGFGAFQLGRIHAANFVLIRLRHMALYKFDLID